MILDRELEQQLRAERSARGADRYDEVWEGIYMMAPAPNDEHQELVMELGAILHEVIGRNAAGDVRPGVNISDRHENWEQNYRVPDIAVFLRGGQARNLGALWLGGPDLVIEIVSPGDQTREKMPFYEQVGVRELLIVDRDPWSLELLRLTEGHLGSTGRSDLECGQVLSSAVIPFTFQLVPGEERPGFESPRIREIAIGWSDKSTGSPALPTGFSRGQTTVFVLRA